MYMPPLSPETTGYSQDFEFKKISTSSAAINIDNWVRRGQTAGGGYAWTTKHVEKSPWRIQEARKLFALLREEYKDSKKLSLRRRYRELERIIEMFTAEPITQRLLYLSTAESELRYNRALKFSRRIDLSCGISANSAVRGQVSAASSSNSIASHTARTVSSRITSSCTSGDRSWNTSISTDTSSVTSTFKSDDSLSLNLLSDSSREDILFNSVETPAIADSDNLCWSATKTKSRHNVLTATKQEEKRNFLEIPRIISKDPTSASPHIGRECQGPHGVPCSVRDGPCSQHSEQGALQGDSCGENNSEDGLGNVCSKVYNFLLAKLNPKVMRPSVMNSSSFDSRPHSETNQERGKSGGHHVPSVNPVQVTPARREHVEVERSRSISPGCRTRPRLPEVTSVSACSTPSLKPKQNWLSSWISVSSQDEQDTPKDLASSGSLRNLVSRKSPALPVSKSQPVSPNTQSGANLMFGSSY